MQTLSIRRMDMAMDIVNPTDKMNFKALYRWTPYSEQWHSTRYEPTILAWTAVDQFSINFVFLGTTTENPNDTLNAALA